MRCRPELYSALLIAALATSCTSAGEVPVSASPIGTARPTFADRSWVSVATLPVARSHLGAVAVSGAIYAIGGLEVGAIAGSAAVERYDPTLNTWTHMPDLPVASDHAAVAATSTQVFVFGGGFAIPTSRAFVFDITAGRWREIAPLPEPRVAGGAAVARGYLYVVGGFGSDRHELRNAYAYDIATDAWAPIPDLPTPREHLAVAAYRGEVCAIGGHFGGATQTDMVECYDPTDRRWSARPSLPKRASDFAAAAVGDTLWTTGDDVQVFDGERWWIGPPLPTPRFGVAAAVIDHSLYVIGGAARRPAAPGSVDRLDLP